MSKFSDRYNKFMRSLQRAFLGQSNRFETFYADTIGMGAVVQGSIPNPDDRLEFEADKVKVEGPRRDIVRVRCLDNVIGTLSYKFNSEAAREIEQHIADVADSLARVRAYKIDGEQKTPVDRLTYKNVTIPLGPKAE